MIDWTETYRGAVPPWQCDVTEHFTVGYYFDRIEEAEPNLADELVLSDLPRRGGLPRRIDVRFARELRAGASFHVESAALGVEPGGGGLRWAIGSSTRPTARSSPGLTSIGTSPPRH